MLDRDPSVPPCNDKEEGGGVLESNCVLQLRSAEQKLCSFILQPLGCPLPPVFFENDRLSILLLAAMTKLESTRSLGVRTIVV